MRLVAANKNQLLIWGAKYLERCADELEQTNFSPADHKVIPAEVRYEIRKLRNWITRARKLTSDAKACDD
jgi:hypothetical protein